MIPNKKIKLGKYLKQREESRKSLTRLKSSCRKLVNNSIFNFLIAVLILISVSLIIWEFLLPDGSLRNTLIIINEVITLIFVIELSLRAYCSSSKYFFLRTYWIDIISVLPVFRIFRTLRLLALLRALRLFRASLIFLKIGGVLKQEEASSLFHIASLALSSFFIISCSALAFVALKHDATHKAVALSDFIDNFWNSAFLFVSGEIISPLDGNMNRIVGIMISLAGLVVFAVLVGTVTAFMGEFIKRQLDTKDSKLEDLEGHTIICGWDRVGTSILLQLERVPELWSKGVVIITDSFDKIDLNKIKDSSKIFHFKADFTKSEKLSLVGAKKAERAIIIADKAEHLRDQDRDARTVLAALTLEKLNPNIYTTAELLDGQNAEHLRLAGVEEIIARADFSAALLANAAINSGATKIIKSILSDAKEPVIRKLGVTDELVGNTFVQALGFAKSEFNATIIAIENNNQHTINPAANYIIQSGDQLIMLVPADSILFEAY